MRVSTLFLLSLLPLLAWTQPNVSYFQGSKHLGSNPSMQAQTSVLPTSPIPPTHTMNNGGRGVFSKDYDALLPDYLREQLNPPLPQPATLPNYGKMAQMVNPSPFPNTGFQSPSANYLRSQARVQQDMQLRSRQQAMTQQLLAEAERDFALMNRKKNLNELPSYRHISTTNYYRTALSQLQQMLQKEKYRSVKDAVYLVENAFYQNSLPYGRFTTYITEALTSIQSAMKKDGYSFDNQQAKKLYLHQYLMGKMEKINASGAVIGTTNPIRYDFDDPMGAKDHRKMFVSRLMDEGKGQCHSMPLLYLILAEALDIEAWLSLSPNHSFIRLQDDKGEWYNLETTVGQYVEDQFLMESGYISTESIREGMYLDTLSKKELLAQCLTDLAGGYVSKYGYDKFVLKCAETALQYHPKNISALIFKANYYGYWLIYAGNNLGLRSIEEIKKHPLTSPILKERDARYQKIDQLGYSPMSNEEYKKWLQSYHSKHNKKFPRP